VDAGAAGSLARHRTAWYLRHHPLTELPNGLGVRDHMANLRKAGSSGVGVFYIDLDGFKAVNDDHGSVVGDDVLRVTGRRLAAICRGRDFLAHLHGDEFLVLAPGVCDDTEAAALARRLVEAIESPILHAVGELRVSATVGFRVTTDVDAIDVAIRGADHDMQDAKRAKAAATGHARRRS
jgi:diguanylate cyclase (GGDEF)-like protein